LHTKLLAQPSSVLFISLHGSVAAPLPPLPSELCRLQASFPNSPLCAMVNSKNPLPPWEQIWWPLYLCGAPFPCYFAPRTEPFALLFCQKPRGGRGAPLLEASCSLSIC
jgi:hypothetical protein